MSQHHLPWDQLFDLHVVKKVEKLVNQRWNLGLGYVDMVTHEVRPPRAHELAAFPGVCRVIQGCEAGDAACRDTARQVADMLSRRDGSQPFTLGCHADLRELVAPIVLEDTNRDEDACCLGALLCGGFLFAGEGTTAGDRALMVAALDQRAYALHVAPSSYQASREHVPWLDARDVSFASELLQAAAEEIAAYYRDELRHHAPPPRRDPGAPAVRSRYGAIIGQSAPMQELYSIVDRVVRSDATVLIQGENGTGKELVARAIHEGSARKDRRFVVVNCSAFNDNLLDSELFGHKKGAFTGAVTDKQGLFEVADQGTFFLDEIGDMSPALQVKVLRVLQEGTFTPVGDTEMRKADVRVIAATNRDLKAMVASGQFREDLFYRINVINLHIPPLRERREDIELLIARFLDKHRRDGRAKTLSRSCTQRLLAYDWPGNVRELENEIERLTVLAGDRDVIDEELLSERIYSRSPGMDVTAVGSGTTHSLPRAMRRLERRMILEALQRNDWNKTRAAAELEISRRNLIRLVQKYQLEAERDK